VLCPTPAPVARPSGIADAAPDTAVPASASSPKTANFNFIWYFLYSKAPVTTYLFLSELELSARIPRYFLRLQHSGENTTPLAVTPAHHPLKGWDTETDGRRPRSALLLCFNS
jgi:hypothetical protein